MFRTFLLAVVALRIAGGPVARAQSGAAEPVGQGVAGNRPRNLLLLLNRLSYDTNSLPPLIVVDADRWLPDAAWPEGRVSIASVAEATGGHLVAAGNMRALVPLTMPVITDKPGKANPFAGMRPDETLKLLLSTLTHAQWQLIGGENGIGIGDLTEDQKLLWDEIMPATMKIQRSTVVPGDKPFSTKYTNTTMLPVDEPEAVRVRLNRQVYLNLYKSGSRATGLSSAGMGTGYFEEAAGQTIYLMCPAPARREPNVDSRTSVYGVPLITTQPNRLKASVIDYDSPKLDTPVSLHFAPRAAVAPTDEATNAEVPPGFATRLLPRKGLAAAPADKADPELQVQARARADAVRADAAESSARKAELPTVADILHQVSKLTHYNIIADRRIRDSLVFLRGDSARSGDVLQALARSVCGSFRKIDGVQGGPPEYLLTSDIEGVGARVSRLSDWVAAAEEVKRTTMQGVIERAAASDPASCLTFSRDDKFALTADMAKRAEESWRSGTDGTDVSRDELSPALRGALDSMEGFLNRNGEHLRNDRVSVSEELGLSYIVPGIGPVKDNNAGSGAAQDFLRKISPNSAHVETTKKPVAATAKATGALPPPVGFPNALKRRVLLAVPGTPDQTAALVSTAAAKGFSDVWFTVSLADMSATTALLKAATKAGAGRITTGAAVSLLRERGGLTGEPERDIQGESGGEIHARLRTRFTSSPYISTLDAMCALLEGWIAPDREELTTRLKRLASIPDLGEIALLSTAAPGWTGAKQGGDATIVELGYSLETRRKFLDAYGMDPIDIVNTDEASSLNSISWSLGAFPLQSPAENYIMLNKDLVPGLDEGAPRSALVAFRAKENRQMLADLYADLKSQIPGLPLFLDDRLSSYGWGHPLSWFGSWDAGDHLPVNPPYRGESEGHAAARKASKTIFADWDWRWTAMDAAKMDAPKVNDPATFALKVAADAARNGPPAWDGIALDMTSASPADLIRLLGGLPDGTAP